MRGAKPRSDPPDCDDSALYDGEVAADFDVSLNGGTVYTAFAQGYLTPDDESADEGFDRNVVQDTSY